MASFRRHCRLRPALASLAVLLLLIPRSVLAVFGYNLVALPGRQVRHRIEADDHSFAAATAAAGPSRHPPAGRPPSVAAVVLASSSVRRGGGDRRRRRRLPIWLPGDRNRTSIPMPDNVGDDVDSKELKIAGDAVSSIRFCCRAALAAFVSDVVVTLIELDTLSKRTMTWIEAVDICDTLNLLVLGLGLWRVSKYYATALETREKMPPNIVLDLVSTMATLWRNTALVLVGGAMAMSASLAENLGFLTGQPFALLPGIVASVALVGFFVLAGKCVGNASDAVEKRGNPPILPGYERARSVGFVASRNMRLCTGAFVLVATMQLASWIFKPATVVERIFNVFDFITPFSIAGLLLSLYHSFLLAVINASSSSQGFSSTVGLEQYNDLFEAQKGFYSKAGETLRSQAIFAVLPYAFAVVKSLSVAVEKAVRP